LATTYGHLSGLQGLSGRPRWRRAPNLPTPAPDLVDRQFVREKRDELWVTDITEHPTRRVVGWSIDSTSTATLVTNALGMARSDFRER
jgi:putative transposase